MGQVCRYLLYYMTAFIIYTDASMYSKFKNEYFFPNFVEKSPNNTLMVEYEKWRIKGGTYVHRADVVNKPKIKYSGKSDSLYTLCMAFPDAPADFEPDKYREWDHWLVINIPSSLVERGEEIFPYEFPLQRRKPSAVNIPYVFVVYEQPGKLDIKPEHLNATARQMGLFIFKNFVNKYKLKGPVCGNYLFLLND